MEGGLVQVIASSKFFLSIVSRNYFESRPCLLECACQADLDPDAKRLFVIDRNGAFNQQDFARAREKVSTEFPREYKRLSEHNRIEMFDQATYRPLAGEGWDNAKPEDKGKVRAFLGGLAEEMRLRLDTAAEPTGDAASAVPATGATSSQVRARTDGEAKVFISHPVSDRMSERRKEMIAYLQSARPGLQIAPSQNLCGDLSIDQFRAALREELADCTHCVHLLGTPIGYRRDQRDELIDHDYFDVQITEARQAFSDVLDDTRRHHNDRYMLWYDKSVLADDLLTSERLLVENEPTEDVTITQVCTMLLKRVEDFEPKSLVSATSKNLKVVINALANNQPVMKEAVARLRETRPTMAAFIPTSTLSAAKLQLFKQKLYREFDAIVIVSDEDSDTWVNSELMDYASLEAGRQSDLQGFIIIQPETAPEPILDFDGLKLLNARTPLDVDFVRSVLEAIPEPL
ncbi:MAG: hypothetical protein AAGK02_07025 [Pseudomonadota bacterium]